MKKKSKKSPKGKYKVQKVMDEFKSGSLKSSSGDKVTNRKQAIAIALSEQRKYEHGGYKKKKKGKRKK